MSSTPDLNELRHQYVSAMQRYHTYGDSPLTDEQFDALKAKIRKLSPEDPVLKLVGAPSPAESHLKKAKHGMHMGSVCNSDRHGDDYADGFGHWLEKMDWVPLVATLKVDGLSVAIRYEDGLFKQAITRGDGQVGEDITANVVRMIGVPFVVPEQFTGWVRAEIVLTAWHWNKLKESGEFTTARNAAAGIARRKDGDNAEVLSVVAHDVVLDEEDFETFSRRMQILEWLGFETPKPIEILNPEQAKLHYEHTALTRESLPYEIDGIVFTVNDTKKLRELGIDGEACWRGQVAWKFPAMEATTRLVGVKLTVGHTGQINPTAELEPVTIGGVSVSSASLCNYAEVKRLGISIGDIVKVSRQGDVIPKVIGLWDSTSQHAPEGVQTEIVEPTKCPVCGGAVGKRTNVSGDDGVHLYCLNNECGAKTMGKLKRWIKSLDIQGIGDEVLEALVEVQDNFGKPYLLNSVVDLYRLHEDGRRDMFEMLKVNGRFFGKSRVAKILAEIDKTRTLTIDQFLGSLGINGLGKRRVQLIREAWKKTGGTSLFPIDALDNIESWFPDQSRASLLITYASNIGLPNTAREIQDGLCAKRPLIKDLLKYITITTPAPEAAPAADSKFAGKTVCFTGCRADEAMKGRMASLGIEEKSGVSKGLSWLVMKTVDVTSSKAKKAMEQGVEMVAYEHFKEMLA
jgi:DNA ligase (NAD+)